jgi:hypothetical protein
MSMITKDITLVGHDIYENTGSYPASDVIRSHNGESLFLIPLTGQRGDMKLARGLEEVSYVRENTHTIEA